MFELSVNIEYMFQEAGEDLPDRVHAAAEAGFRKVEMFTTAGRDLPTLGKSLQDQDVELWTLLVDPRTLLVDPGTHAGFLEMFKRTAEDARTLGCRRVVVGSGPAVPYQKRKQQLETVTRAVAAAAPIAQELELTILLEAVNTRVDHPGVLFSRTEDSATVVAGVASPNVRLLYDLYHSVAEGENPAEVLQQVSHMLGHVQIADYPGRGEPGTGTIDWNASLQLLRDAGYTGTLGVECYPVKSPTWAALQYIRKLCTQ